MRFRDEPLTLDSSNFPVHLISLGSPDLSILKSVGLYDVLSGTKEIKIKHHPPPGIIVRILHVEDLAHAWLGVGEHYIFVPMSCHSLSPAAHPNPLPHQRPAPYD